MKNRGNFKQVNLHLCQALGNGSDVLNVYKLLFIDFFF